MTKQCSKCNVIKDFSEFNKNKNSKDGHRSACKTCMSKYRKQNKDKIKAQQQAWLDANREHVNQQRKQYRELNAESISAAKKEWYYNNPDKVKASYERRLKRIRNGEASYSDWASKNPEKVREIKQNYKHKRREKEREGSLTTSEFSKFISFSIKICVYCGTNCNDGYHVDHIEPLSKGGEHSLDNLAISCPSCNLRKSNKSLLRYLAEKVVEAEDKKPQR